MTKENKQKDWREEFDETFRDYEFAFRDTDDKLKTFIQNLLDTQLEEVVTKLDSVVNANLWGDYGLSTGEVYEGCKRLLEELKDSIKKKK